MKRVQRKRTAGWRMPPNTVYVGRPTRWGNPYLPSEFSNPKECLFEYERWLLRRLAENPHFLDDLIMKDLACWCPLNKPCHADILLEYLKKEGVEKP